MTLKLLAARRFAAGRCLLRSGSDDDDLSVI